MNAQAGRPLYALSIYTSHNRMKKVSVYRERISLIHVWCMYTLTQRAFQSKERSFVMKYEGRACRRKCCFTRFIHLNGEGANLSFVIFKLRLTNCLSMWESGDIFSFWNTVLGTINEFKAVYTYSYICIKGDKLRMLAV